MKEANQKVKYKIKIPKLKTWQTNLKENDDKQHISANITQRTEINVSKHPESVI